MESAPGRSDCVCPALVGPICVTDMNMKEHAVCESNVDGVAAFGCGDDFHDDFLHFALTVVHLPSRALQSAGRSMVDSVTNR